MKAKFRLSGTGPHLLTSQKFKVSWDSWGYLLQDSFPNLCRLHILCTNYHRCKMWARKRLPLSRTAGVNRPLVTWRHCVPWHLFLCMPILQSHLSFILMLMALVWELSSTKLREDGTEAVIAYASRSLNKAESHYPAHKLEFLTLKWAVVKKFHEYLLWVNLWHVHR